MWDLRKCIQNVSGENLKGRNYLRDLGVEERAMLKTVGCEGVSWIAFHNRRGISWPTERLFASERLRYVRLAGKMFI